MRWKPLICSVDWQLQVTSREQRALINIFLGSNKQSQLSTPLCPDKYISDSDRAKRINLSKQSDDFQGKREMGHPQLSEATLEKELRELAKRRILR